MNGVAAFAELLDPIVDGRQLDRRGNVEAFGCLRVRFDED